MPSKSLRSIPALRGTLPTSKRPVHVAETFIEIGGRRDSLQERECAILQLHDHAFESVESRWDFDQMQRDGLFRAEHRAGSHAKNKRVTNLSSGPGDRDFDR
mgnify:CR=1 FL=1